MKHLIIIPALNEEENIKEIIPKILNKGDIFNVLLVIDKSTDNTEEVAKELARNYPGVYVLIKKEKGLGKSYIQGFKWALKRDYDLIFEMDADGSHDPSFLPLFLEKAKEYDLVVGSRYYNKRISVVNWDLKRLFLSLSANLYAKIITRVPVSDATAGFKCFKRKVLESIDLDRVISEGYSFQIEMNWKAWRAGFKIGELPIIFYERKHGKSKLSTSIIKEGLWILWKIRFKK